MSNVMKSISKLFPATTNKKVRENESNVPVEGTKHDRESF